MGKVIKKVKRYFLNILISFDQFVNTISGGDPDETISGRIGKNFKNSELRKLVDFLFRKGHCAGAIEEDEGDNAVLD